LPRRPRGAQGVREFLGRRAREGSHRRRPPAAAARAPAAARRRPRTRLPAFS